MYADLAKREDSTKAAELLVEEILAESKEVVIGLWTSLFVLMNRSSHPNLFGMVEEILYNGNIFFGALFFLSPTVLLLRPSWFIF